MTKKGEIEYLDNLGEHGIAHAVNKPFSDPECGTYLMRIGALMLLLPPPPATLLELGCGTGWSSAYFAQAGYNVTGVDISPTMVELAQAKWKHVPNLTFLVADYETFDPGADSFLFDCAVFFDSLHHALDEGKAIAAAYRALKPGGVCITDEPGVGHAESPASQEAMKQFDVTEKDMPPKKIARLAREAGFKRSKILPGIQRLWRLPYAPHMVRWPAWFERIRPYIPFVDLIILLAVIMTKRRSGLCVLYK